MSKLRIDIPILLDPLSPEKIQIQGKPLSFVYNILKTYDRMKFNRILVLAYDNIKGKYYIISLFICPKKYFAIEYKEIRKRKIITSSQIYF